MRRSGKFLLEQPELPDWPAKRSRKSRTFRIQSRLPARDFEQIRDVFRIRATSLHSRAKVRVVQAAAANIANAVENFLFLQWPVQRQPFFKKGRDTVRKTQRDITCRNRAGFSNSSKNRGHFVIGEAGNHRRHQCPTGTPAEASALDGRKPPRRLRCARLELAREFGIERRR